MTWAALEEEDDTALDSACELMPAVAALATAPRELDTVAALEATSSLTEDEDAVAAAPRPVVLALQDLFFFFFSPSRF